jgi:hypothetical protein
MHGLVTSEKKHFRGVDDRWRSGTDFGGFEHPDQHGVTTTLHPGTEQNQRKFRRRTESFAHQCPRTYLKELRDVRWASCPSAGHGAVACPATETRLQALQTRRRNESLRLGAHVIVGSPTRRTATGKRANSESTFLETDI